MNNNYEDINSELYNLFDFESDNYSNEIPSRDTEIRQKSKRIDIAIAVLQLFKQQPEMTPENLEQQFAEKYGEETAKRMMEKIIGDMKFVTQELEKVKPTKRETFGAGYTTTKKR